MFELWIWRRLLRVPWTARRTNQSFLDHIKIDCSIGVMINEQIRADDGLEKKRHELCWKKYKGITTNKVTGSRRLQD